MSKAYIIYCDESISEGRFFSNFYGGALVRSEDLFEVETILNQRKSELNLQKELKWSRVSSQYLEKYQDFINTYFDLIASNKIKIRVMFTQNRYKPTGLSREQTQNSYFLLYYQFLKHAFGLLYSNPKQEPVTLQINLDQLPDTREKSATFKQYLLGLNNNKQFIEAKIRLKLDRISEIDSSKHTIIQGLDIILGAMAFRLNDMHLEKPDGSKRRGQRTIAKEKLYKQINQRIREIYPGFNIGVSTGDQNDIQNRWRHPYRHWLFIPSEYEIDTSKTK
ncbi:DUF3800 domain-containing protein [Leptolyngbya sp. AN02str]|uniref:DUF3800 domain-containing protein n=1 Tax=Leptolyngbya sp. AN02str TaxID=3423363 RepID=UPI003D30F086